MMAIQSRDKNSPRNQPQPGQVAQSVEQWTENPRVGSSILSLATIHYFADKSSWLIVMDEKKKSVGVRTRIVGFWNRCCEQISPDAIFSLIMRPVVLAVVPIGLVVWHYFDETKTATFVVYLIGGILLLAQIQASSKRAKAAEDTATAMQKTVNLTEKGNVAERFKNAIEHLGHESPSIRLGGIYALHHIAQEDGEAEEEGDVEEYRERVFQILCAHVRETTTQEVYKPQERIFPKEGADTTGQPGLKTNIPSIEIESISNLLFVRNKSHTIYRKFRANLERAILEGASLKSANLRNAYLPFANLRRVSLHNSNLQNAFLFSINLEGAYLSNVNLQGAILSFSNLQGARLDNTNLQGCDLHRANLKNAKNLTVEQLLKAKTLYQAKLPDGMEAEIRQHKPELLKKPNPDNEPEA